MNDETIIGSQSIDLNPGLAGTPETRTEFLAKTFSEPEKIQALEERIKELVSEVAAAKAQIPPPDPFTKEQRDAMLAEDLLAEEAQRERLAKADAMKALLRELTYKGQLVQAPTHQRLPTCIACGKMQGEAHAAACELQAALR